MIYNPFFEQQGINAVVVPMGCKSEDYPDLLRSVFRLDQHPRRADHHASQGGHRRPAGRGHGDRAGGRRLQRGASAAGRPPAGDSSTGPASCAA
jgi:hypothetical protein